MYLIDTSIVSEMRKGERANPGVRAFFSRAASADEAVYLSVVTVGELRRGVELVRHRGDTPRADVLEQWLRLVLDEHEHNIRDLDADAAQVWGKLRVPHHENELDKQIAATALVHDLTIVTRHEAHFLATGAKLLNPFALVP